MMVEVPEDFDLFPPPRIVIVDDFVTKGRTLYAAATVVSRAFPNSDLRGFALVRTMGFIDDIPRIVEPVVGVLRRDASGAVRREP